MTDAESGGRKLRYLKGTELFRDFTRAQLEPFHQTIRMETCRAGHVFYRPGETGEVMFLLKEGGAQLYRLAADGRKFVFADVPPSSIFGEMGVPIREVRLGGGGARSSLWREIQAEVYGQTVSTVKAEEGAAYGAAILAGVGAGVSR